MSPRLSTLVATALVAATATAVNGQSVSSSQNDLDTLNYALTLEHLEAAYYAAGQATFNSSQFQAAGFPASAYDDLNLIAQEEATHVAALTQTIQQLGGTPVTACNYNFAAALTSVPNYLTYAAAFENVGVGAYDGAIFAITTPALAQVAAQIAVIEGRHAGYINTIQGLLPFPLALDNATTPTEVVNMVAPYFASCPVGSATSTWPAPNGLPGLSLPMNRALTTGYAAAANATANDLITVNYAITYENLEVTFYSMLLDMFNETDFTNAGFSSQDYDWLTLILRNERTHVQILQTVGLLLGNSAPLPVCQYNFPNVTSPAQAVAYMALVCGTGAGAFTGAANTIKNPIIQQAAAQIATTEGRQVAFLETLIGTNPVAYTFQRAYNTSTVVDFASNFLVGCPYTVAGPAPLGMSSAYSTDPPQSNNLASPYNTLKHNKHFKSLRK